MELQLQSERWRETLQSAAFSGYQKGGLHGCLLGTFTSVWL